MRLTPIRLLVALTVLNHTAFAGSRVAIPLGALELGASPFAIGLLLSFYGLLPMFLAVPAGRWIDRVGMRLPMLAGTGLLAFGVAVPFLTWDIGAMYLASVTIGLGMMGYYLAVQKAAGMIGGDASRTANFSLMALGFSMSGFLGPTSAGVAIDLIGHRWTFALLAAAALATLAVLLRASLTRELPAPGPQVAGPPAPPTRLMDLLGTPELRRLYLSVVVLSSAWDVHQFLVPLYGASLGISASKIGLVLGAFSVATFIVRLTIPWLAGRVGDWPPVLGAMAVAALVYLAYPVFPVLSTMLALSFLLGLGLGVAQPMMMAVLYRASPHDRIGEAAGLRMTLINGTQTFLPTAFGAFGAAFGLSAIFWGMALLIAGGGAHVWRGLRQEERD
ncbi:MFS transporter [Zeimonas arvi]|uniref:MFS transporter n=1 Tax=Zeimonas arvi TaxID=2498847 RepID=A0A5C8P5J3_9BURK|nr:MFS transporter [Zeimonas arvi]TXL68384.1 MFS transporter [Zeimonas arvi]